MLPARTIEYSLCPSIRACAKVPPPPEEPTLVQDLTIDASKVWKLAMAYKKDLNRATYESGRVMQDFLICKILEGDLADFSFVGQGLYQNNSFLISNLCVFEPREEMVDGGWSIKDVGFSSGVIRAALSDFGPVFDVASVKGGDCDLGQPRGRPAEGRDGEGLVELGIDKAQAVDLRFFPLGSHDNDLCFPLDVVFTFVDLGRG
ncbi:hypothetical protein BGZ57DRAFT_990551 [Hyaloscypha finlandica]|nr:hypothetical protein BGZ57DRAFT_990551 [Hyaloscypha finlandica]